MSGQQPDSQSASSEQVVPFQAQIKRGQTQRVGVGIRQLVGKQVDPYSGTGNRSMLEED